VVNDAASLALTSSSQTATGTVIGIDEPNDLALIRSSAPFSGHVFTVASTLPDVGTPVAAIGYPIALPITLTQGTISGLDRKVPIENTIRTGLIQTDAAINPGNSGGPLLSTSGDVVGLVDAGSTNAQGIGFAVSGVTAEPMLSGWQSSPQPQPPSTCASPTGPDADVNVQSTVTAPDAPAIENTISTYFHAVNTADWHTAWLQYSPLEQAQVPEANLAQGDQSSYIATVSLDNLAVQPDGSEVASVSFTSVQNAADGPNGDTCDNWTLNYTMRLFGGVWLIDAVAPQNGGTGYTPCAG
jgi:hypothetical protein